MSSQEIVQVQIAKEGANFGNLGSGQRTPSTSGLVFGGLSCANPEFKAEVRMAQDQAVANRFYKRPPLKTLQQGSISFDLYLRGPGYGNGFDDPQFAVYDALFGKQHTSNASYTVSLWTSTTQFTVSSASGLKVGQGFAVQIGEFRHVSFITSIIGNVIRCEPALPGTVIAAAPATIRGGRTYAVGRDFADDSSVAFLLLREAYQTQTFACAGKSWELPLKTGEEATAKVGMISGYYVPLVTRTEPGETTEPEGSWLKFLNAECQINGYSRNVASCAFKLDNAPSAKKTPANAIGAAGYEMSAPSLSATIELSEYDDTFGDMIDDRTEFPLLATLTDQTNGNTAAIYMPRVHLTAFPEPTAIENLTGMPLEVEAGLYTGDSEDFDSASDTLAGSLLRVFFERG